MTIEPDNAPVSGTPIWFDNPSSDREAGKEFYSAVFGWGWHEFTSDVLGTYSLATLHGRDVAALLDEQYAVRGDAMPKVWRTYFLFDDVDVTAAKCVEAGGKVLRGKAAHGDLGESIECVTHEGAPFVAWAGRDTLAGRATGDIGTPHWTEYYTRNAEGAYSFFKDVFGITFRKLELPMDPSGETTYTYHLMLDSSGKGVGGMLEMDETWGDLAAHMMVYFAVEDCDATAKLVGDHGGTVCVPPTDIPSGRFSVLEDPQGSTFSVIQSNPDWSPPTN